MRHLSTYFFAVFLFVAVTITVTVIAATAQAQDAVFSYTIDDLPLMPGLVELEEEALIFDKPDGRIIEAVAIGELPDKDIQSFYIRTLPALGWHLVETDQFVRGGEHLALSYEPEGPETLVRFTLSPK